MGYRTTRYKIKVESNKTNSYTDFFYHFFRNILLVFLPLSIISAIILSPPHSATHTSAIDNSNVDALTVAIPVSCTMNVTGGDTHITSIVSGTHKENIGTTTMKSSCNDANGYVIYAIGASGDNNDLNNATEGNTDLVSNFGSAHNIKTGVYNPAGSSSWSMKVTAVNGTYKPTLGTYYASENYVAVPNEWKEVAHWTSGTINAQVGSSIQTTYDVYADNNQLAGIYKGMVKYALLHPSSTSQPATLEEAFDTIIGKANKVEVDGSKYYKMQDMTPAVCNAATISGEASQIELVDIRDNNIYYVTKLMDGNCWMTQNLDLDLISDTTVANYVALTSENTDLNVINNGANYPEYGGTGYTCKNTTTPEATTTADCSGSNEVITWVPGTSSVISAAQWNNNNNNPRSLNGGGGYTDQNIGRHGLTGNYYNWSAAIASNDSSGISADNIAGENREASNSICPKGWRLPQIRDYFSYNTGENDFTNLNFYYNGGKTNTATGLMAAPLYFLQSGVLYSSQVTGSIGSYWSSTVSSAVRAYRLEFSSNNVKPGSSDSRNVGFSIRCLAR